MSDVVPAFGDAQLLELGRLLRQLREQRGWSLKRLATESGISIAAIQKIEAGEANPGFVTIAAITEALGASIDQVISAALVQALNVNFVCGRADGDDTRGFADRSLSSKLSAARMSARLLRLSASSDVAAKANPRGEPFFAFVIGGTVRLTFADDTREELKAGDAIHVKGEIPARWSNPTLRPATVLCVTDLQPGDLRANAYE